jgi:surfeit locus 1 family protein
LPLEEFTRVRLSGRFVPERAMWLGGRTDVGRAGWHIVSPFVLSGGGWVMVDRGWLPMSARSGAGTVPDSGATSIDGVVRLPPEAGMFTPDNDPAANSWYRIDPPAMAAAAGLPADDGVTAVYVAVSELGAGGAVPGASAPGAPLAKGDRFDLPRNHFQYALTWFGLAATLAAVYLAFGMRRRPAPGDDEREPR